MITGFNTDIRHEDVTYHVQTEDKGLDTPLILSLVYVGGAIIASKRTQYDDLIQKGFDEKVLTERLQRQHKLICAAIRAGRVEELKRMGEQAAHAKGDAGEQNGGAKAAGRKSSGTKKKKTAPLNTKDEVGHASESGVSEAPGSKAGQKSEAGQASEGEVGNAAREENARREVANRTPQLEVSYSYFDEKVEDESIRKVGVEPGRAKESGIEIITSLIDEISAMAGDSSTSASEGSAFPRFTPPVHDEWTFGNRETVGEITASTPAAEPPRQPATPVAQQNDTDELYLNLLEDEGDFRAGQLATIKIHVGRGAFGQRPVFDASVTVKVLGTTFRPMIFTTTTDERGVAIVRTMLPHFTSGRAAIIIRAVAPDDAVEMRRIIHQA